MYAVFGDMVLMNVLKFRPYTPVLKTTKKIHNCDNVTCGGDNVVLVREKGFREN